MTGRAPDLSARLLRWYDRAKRGLPWRLPADAAAGARLDPYHVLVSETMLQQTQVATVVPYFRRFVERFPTLAALAQAPEQEVLRLWQGLGYYSRARNLQAAARTIVQELQGRMPETVGRLLSLPGVGRYTAGAVASIAFDQRAPIVDGNVARVICRLDGIETDPRERETLALLWRRAEQLLPGKRVGDFNSALMELGATVCTPRNPQCLLCPVRQHCSAFKMGKQDRIPAPRRRKLTPLERRWAICIERDGRWLIEQRPAKGRWAGMWQFVTLPARGGRRPMPDVLRERLGLQVGPLRPLGQVEHALTHRRYRFRVYRCEAYTEAACLVGDRLRVWVTLGELDQYPLPRPHLKIAALLV